MHDPDIQEMVENGEHTCHMFDAHCQACEDDEEDDNMTLAEIEKELIKVEATKKRLETIRLKKEKKEEGPFEFVDEMTFYSRSCDHLPNF